MAAVGYAAWRRFAWASIVACASIWRTRRFSLRASCAASTDAAATRPSLKGPAASSEHEWRRAKFAKFAMPHIRRWIAAGDA